MVEVHLIEMQPTENQRLQKSVIKNTIKTKSETINKQRKTK